MSYHKSYIDIVSKVSCITYILRLLKNSIKACYIHLCVYFHICEHIPSVAVTVYVIHRMEINILINSSVLNLYMEKEKGNGQRKERTRHKEERDSFIDNRQSSVLSS